MDARHARSATDLRLRGAGLLSVTAAFTRELARDFFSRPPARGSADRHLQAAVDWLIRAHDATPDDGVSQGYYLFRHGRMGWLPSYRETSGYILETFFDLARHGYPDCRQRALRLAYWLCDVQNKDGSYCNPNYGERGVVFDTGQVLLGLVRAYEESSEAVFLDAAMRAGGWLHQVMDDDGAWRRCTHNGCVHTYNTRTAWAMLKLNVFAPDRELEEAARANLEWARTQERDGWFRQNAFTPNGIPYTHNIAYAIRGFLEAGEVLGEPAYHETARRASEAVLRLQAPDGFIPGQIDEHGRARSSSCCLTGNCQLSIIWLKLYRSVGDARFLQAAVRSTEYVMAQQDIDTTDLDIRGGIKGSQPIYGRYATLCYPNWATKFFIDAALMLPGLKS